MKDKTNIMVLALAIVFICVAAAGHDRRLAPASSIRPRAELPEFCLGLKGDRAKPRKIKVEVTESYSGSPTYKTSIAPAIERMLRSAGFVVVTEQPELTLNVLVRGSAVSNAYGSGGTICYNGAQVVGELRVDGMPNAKLIYPFRGRRDPPGMISMQGAGGCIRTSEKAPFDEALYSSNVFDELSVFVRRWYGADSEICYWCGGYQPADGKLFVFLPVARASEFLGRTRDQRTIGLLINYRFDNGMLEDAIMNFGAAAVEPLILSLNGTMRDRSARLLGRIGDRRAVGPLIDAIPRTETAIWALVQITKQDLGRSQARWRAWWNKQPKS